MLSRGRAGARAADDQQRGGDVAGAARRDRHCAVARLHRGRGAGEGRIGRDIDNSAPTGSNQLENINCLFK